MSTRDFSSKQEYAIAKMLNGSVCANSGATKWRKGDVIVTDASLLIECKTTTTEKSSFSIKKEWIDKNREESFSNRLDNSCVAFNFGPDLQNYFVINEKLMRFLVAKLVEDNQNLSN